MTIGCRVRSVLSGQSGEVISFYSTYAVLVLWDEDHIAEPVDIAYLVEE